MDNVAKLKAIADKRAADALAQGRHAEVQQTHRDTQTLIAASFQALINYLDNKVTKTEVVNHLQQIGTPDALRVVQSVESLHATLKTHRNTDLSEITQVMRSLLDEMKKVPKELPNIPEAKLVDNTKHFQSLEKTINGLTEVVKNQKLVAEAPIVHVPKLDVPTPQVHVAAPDLSALNKGQQAIVEAVRAIVIPEFKQDSSSVEKLLKQLDKRLSELPDKMPRGGSFGGGGIASFTNAAGVVTQVQLTATGRVPVADPDLAIQIDESGSITYIGKAVPSSATSASAWQIRKIDATSGTSITWASGDANFNKVWDDRATLTYS